MFEAPIGVALRTQTGVPSGRSWCTGIGLLRHRGSHPSDVELLFATPHAQLPTCACTKFAGSSRAVPISMKPSSIASVSPSSENSCFESSVNAMNLRCPTASLTKSRGFLGELREMLFGEAERDRIEEDGRRLVAYVRRQVARSEPGCAGRQLSRTRSSRPCLAFRPSASSGS